MEQQAAVVLGVLVTAAILWLARSVDATAKGQVRLETILTGSDGTNGIAGNVRELKAGQHRLRGDVQTLRGDHDLLAHEVEHLKERIS